MKAFAAVARLLIAGVLMAIAGSITAQQAYPSKSIRLIVPYPAGGGADPLVRFVGQKLTECAKKAGFNFLHRLLFDLSFINAQEIVDMTQSGITTEYETVLYHKIGHRATITINRPEQRNATNSQFYLDLIAAAKSADQDPDVRVVILTGAGTAFSAGQDQKHTSRYGKDPENVTRNYRRLIQAGTASLKQMWKPVVGRINGPAAGGGCMLALDVCDIAIASTKARFALREVNTGVSGPITLMYSAGRARGLYLALTGAWISAEQAEEWGLVLKAVPHDQLDAEVDKVVTMLEELPPLTLAATKEQMFATLNILGADLMPRMAMWTNSFLQNTEDRKEAQAAFLQKRKGKYVGY